MTQGQPDYTTYPFTLDPSADRTGTRAAADHVADRRNKHHGSALHLNSVAAQPINITTNGRDSTTDTAWTAEADNPTGHEAWQRIVEALEAEIRGLRERQVNLGTIEQAKGMLMAHYRIPADTAFSVLRQCSQHSNTKLRDIAARIVSTGSQSDPGGTDALIGLLRAHRVDLGTLPSPHSDSD